MESSQYRLNAVATERRIPIEVIKGTIDRDLFDQYRGFQVIHNIEVPDYEGVIMKILCGTKQRIWIHGVRLPIDEDLSRL